MFRRKGFGYKKDGILGYVYKKRVKNSDPKFYIYKDYDHDDDY